MTRVLHHCSALQPLYFSPLATTHDSVSRTTGADGNNDFDYWATPLPIPSPGLSFPLFDETRPFLIRRHSGQQLLSFASPTTFYRDSSIQTS